MNVDFYSLERPVQDRFSDATRSIGLPTPILWEPASPNTGAAWALGVVPLVGLLGWGMVRGFGSLESPVALAPAVFALGYGVAVAAIAYCLLRMFGGRNARAA